MELRRTVGPVAATAAVAIGLGAASFGIKGIADTANAPEHKPDLKAAEFYLSEEGNEQRCLDARQQEVAEKLGKIPEKLPEEAAQAFADQMNAVGEEGGVNVTADDVNAFPGTDHGDTPGHDCDAEGGASTYVVLKKAEKNAPIVVGGFGLATFSGGILAQMGLSKLARWRKARKAQEAS